MFSESNAVNAPFKTWKDFLLDILNKNKYDWKNIKSLDFIDTDLIDEIIILNPIVFIRIM